MFLYHYWSYLFAHDCSCSYRICLFLLQPWLRNSVHRTSSAGCSGVPQDFWLNVNIRTVCKTDRLEGNKQMQIVWVMMYAWRNVMTQKLLPVQKHLLPTPLQKTSCSSPNGQCIWDDFFLPTGNTFKHLVTHTKSYFSILFAPLPYSNNFKLNLLRL